MLGTAPWNTALLDESLMPAQRKVITDNFELIASATASLGGIPPMLSAEDCCAPGAPHEHAVIGCDLKPFFLPVRLHDT